MGSSVSTDSEEFNNKMEKIDLKDALEAVSIAIKNISKPYVYNSKGPDSFDCSGLIVNCYAGKGFNIPSNTREYESKAKEGYLIEVNKNDIREGDIIWVPGHVFIYACDGEVISAESVSMKVVKRRIEDVEKYWNHPGIIYRPIKKN